MFLLNELATEEELNEIRTRYQDMDIQSIICLSNLMKTGSQLLMLFENFLKKYQFSQGRFLLLMILYRKPQEAINPSVLAEKLGVKRPTASGLIEKLLTESLIERISHSEDGRMYSLRITKMGINRIDEILPDYYQMINKLTSSYSEDEKLLLTKLLNKIPTTHI